MTITAPTWGAFIVGLLMLIVAGALPVLVTRLICLLYPADHPRREELLLEITHVRKAAQLADWYVWLGQISVTAAIEGVPARGRQARTAIAGWRARRRQAKADAVSTWAGVRPAILSVRGLVTGSARTYFGLLRDVWRGLRSDVSALWGTSTEAATYIWTVTTDSGSVVRTVSTTTTRTSLGLLATLRELVTAQLHAAARGLAWALSVLRGPRR